MDLRRLAHHQRELIDAARGMPRHARHIAQHGDADLHADAGEKADQHRARQEIGEKAQFENARDEQQGGGQQRDHRGERRIFRARSRRHRGEPARENGGGGRIGGHDEMPRCAEKRKRHKRQKDGVKTRDGRHAGDARVAEHLRNIHRRKLHTGQRVAGGAGAAQRKHTFQHADAGVEIPQKISHARCCPVLRLSRIVP
jgi:hypothetical protein